MVSALAMEWRRRAGGCIWSLRLPSSPRTIHGMMSWSPESVNGSGSEDLGLGFGGAKEMLNCCEGSEEVMMRGSVRKGLRVREGLDLERSEDERWWKEESDDATVAAILLFFFSRYWLGFS